MNEDNKKVSEKDASETFISRQIVQEIMDYGVSQFQIAKIIELLALELENRDMMVKIRDIIENNTANNTTGIILDEQEV